MKLLHDIENDLEHTIPPEGAADSRWLFRAMTERSLRWVAAAPGRCIVDLASGLGQDTYALARRTAAGRRAAGSKAPARAPLIVGIEPSNRMIRFGPRFLAPAQGSAGAPQSSQAPGSPRQPREHREPLGPQEPGPARFVRGLGEEIPLRSGSVDALLCKGALDHFMDPDMTVREIVRVLRPGGRAVIALANYDSLSCALGRWRDRGRTRTAEEGAPYYEPPPDHLTRFTYGSIVALARPPLRLRRVAGVSLLWGFPPWGWLLGRLPAPLRTALLLLAHGLAALRPAWADVIVLVAEKRAASAER
jgi:SAM-dependent methyltransferase